MYNFKLSKIHEILCGVNQPWHQANQLQETQFRERIKQTTPLHLATPSFFKKAFQQQYLYSFRIKYYCLVVDNEINAHMNELIRFIDNNDSADVLLYLIKQSTESIQTVIHEAVEELEFFTTPENDIMTSCIDSRTNRVEKEYAIILHYTIASLVWLWVEIQNRYSYAIESFDLLDVVTIYHSVLGTEPPAFVAIKATKEDNGTGKRNKGVPPYACFVYNKSEEDWNINMSAFYHKLVQYEMIPADTDQMRLLEIFRGRNTFTKIEWMGNPAVLVMLMKALVNKEKLVTMSPVGAKIWQVTNLRFVGPNDANLNISGNESPRVTYNDIIKDLVSTLRG